MKSEFSCPACDATKWQGLGSIEFGSDAPGDAYRSLRLRILFERWAPGLSEFSARFVLCQACGFVCYGPRPTTQEVEDKYAFLAEHAPPEEVSETIRPLDVKRSQEILDFMGSHLTGSDVLDFGGGNGALLNRFVERGLKCGVVDYVDTTVRGVERWGDTLDDLPKDRRFDSVLACHVIEHLADPHEVCVRIRRLLSPGGTFFVEVPLEILGGLPPMREPVTHLNFFCESSLVALLQRAGFSVIKVRTMACRFQSGAVRYGVRAIATPSDQVRPQRLDAAQAKRLLSGDPLSRLGLALLNPKMLGVSLPVQKPADFAASAL